MIAALPMYDWPEVRDATDALWESIRARLDRHGFSAPRRLDRSRTPRQAWLDPGLVLAQTCGYPAVRELAGRVRHVGTPSYDAGGCGAGTYSSHVVVREDDAATALEDLRGRRAAFSSPCSQSGYHALRHHVAPLARDGGFFASALETGSHRESIRAVASDRADAAAVDAVSFLLARRHEPATRSLRVLMTTAVTPGLPLITALELDDDALGRFRSAVGEGVESLDEESRRALGILALEPLGYEAYALIAERDRTATALGYPVLA